MPEIDLTKLSGTLYGREARERSQVDFIAAYESFRSFFLALDSFGVYFDNTYEWANVGNTVTLLRRLVDEFGFQKRAYLILDQSDQTLCALIAERLPFFKANAPFKYGGCDLSVVDTNNIPLLDTPFIVTGGCGMDDDFLETLGAETRYFAALQPFLSDDESFIRIREPQDGEWLCLIADVQPSVRPLGERPIKRDLERLRAIPPEIEAWWRNTYHNLDLCKKLIALASRTALIPVTGLAAAMDRGENAALILALAALDSAPVLAKPIILAFLDHPSVKDPHFDMLKLFADTSKSPNDRLAAILAKYPQADAAAVKAGIIDPLAKKPGLLSRGYDIVFADTPPDNPSAGKVYIVALGALPYDYVEALAAVSAVFFFERQDMTNTAVNLGVPYLQKSIDAAALNYPDFENPAAVLRMHTLADIFRFDIHAYLAGVDKSIDAEIDQLSSFFKSPETAYFQSIARNASNPLSDKLAALGAMFMGYKAEVEQGVQVETPDADSDQFIELYYKLRGCYHSATEKLNITRALSPMCASDYLRTMVGGDMVLALSSVDDISLLTERDCSDGDSIKDPQSIGVKIGNARWNGGAVSITLSSPMGGKNIQTTLDGALEGDAVLFGLSWLRFKKPYFNVTVYEDGTPVSGAVGGVLANTEIHLAVELSGISGTKRIMTLLDEPVTTLDALEAVTGGVDFLDSIPPALRAVGGFGVSGLEFTYDENKGTVTQMAFTLATDRPWVLWERGGTALLTAAPLVEIRILNPADLTGRQIEVSIGAFVGVGSDGTVGSLWLSASYPPFVAEMRLASEKIALAELLALFGVTVDFACDITVLRVYADFTNGIYQLSAAIETDWEIVKDMFRVTGLGLLLGDRAGNLSVAFSGSVLICGKLNLAAAVSYQDGDWALTARASIGDTVSMKELLSAYADNAMLVEGNDDDNPPLASLEFSLIRHKAGGTDWEITAEASGWKVSAIDLTVETAKAAVGRKNGSFYASLSASLELLGAEFTVALDFAAAKRFTLMWGDYTGVIASSGGETMVTITLTDFSVGGMIETFTSWLAGSPFKLDPPWDILNEFKAGKLNLVYNFTKKRFSFTVNADIKLGFATMKGVEVVYDPSAAEKILVELVGSFAWQKGDRLSWDASQPGTAPAPAGQGNKYFDLRLLALGQRMAFFESGYHPDTADAAIAKLAECVDPEKPPEYSADAGWLVASSFGILRDASGGYFLDAALVFYDPSLYALRIRLTGAAAKIFDGFMFEVLYAKLSDTLGVYKGRILVPNKFRRLDIGAYTITLPDFYLEIYTNGDFKIDVGFPKNGDFSRSFTLEGIIPPGLPVTGSAGLYFGKLSSASAAASGAHLPSSDCGLFNPAIVFGLGIRMGVGKSISYGILSGGFSLTLQTIIEGVIAKWCPYDLADESEWYYYLDGSAAIVANIYGMVDFCIISASVTLTLGASAGFTYESYRALHLTLCAWVEAEATLTINLGLFKIRISFSFRLKVRETFTIGSDKPAPWDGNALPPHRMIGFPVAAPLAMDFSNLRPDGAPSVVHALLSLAVTAAADEWSGAGRVLGNVALTLKEDAFHSLAEMLMCWVAAAGLKQRITAGNLQSAVLDDEYLAGIEAYLNGDGIAQNDIDAFLSSFFRIAVLDNAAECVRLASENTAANDGIFMPLPPSLELTAAVGVERVSSYTLGEYNAVSGGGLAVLRETFDRLAVMAGDGNKLRAGAANDSVSVARWVFGDWFLLAARQLTRYMREALRRLERTGAAFCDIAASVRGMGAITDLAGMASRYSLHGLRLPTVDADVAPVIVPRKQGLWVERTAKGFALPPEAGLFALTGGAFLLPEQYGETTPFIVTPASRCDYLVIPGGFTLEINTADGSAQTVESLARFIKTGAFHISHTLDKPSARFVPAVLSFAAPVSSSDGRTVWETPSALTAYCSDSAAAPPRFGIYAVSFDDGEAQKRSLDYTPLALLEFSARETDTRGVYILEGAPEASSLLLRRLIDAAAFDPALVRAVSLQGGKDTDFLAVTRIDLSTETHPPTPDSAAGSPDELLTLFWEAFVTNNGGYVLTYRGGAEPNGGKFTLAVSLALCDASRRLMNAVSCEGGLAGNETVAAFAEPYSLTVPFEGTVEAFAARYVCDVRSLAENNPDIALNTSVAWNVSGHIHIADGGAGPRLRLADIAAHYGVTADAIRAANSGMAIGDTLEDGQAIKLPDLNARPQGGDTLTVFAARYFIDPARLLWQNRAKDSLFSPGGASVKVTVCAGGRVGDGAENTPSPVNEHYVIHRTPPPDMPEPGAPEYPEALLKNNYTLLRFSVAENGDFAGSGGSLPEPPDSGYRYHTVMPAAKYADGTPVGRLLQNNFEWLDYYGNRLPQRFTSARLVGYQDALCGPAGWKSSAAEWSVGSGAVLLSFSFAAEDYTNPDAAAPALLFYQALRAQLLDSRVRLTFTCPLFAAPRVFPDKNAVLTWLEGICTYLEDRASGAPSGLTVSFPLDRPPSEPFLVLTAHVAIERDGRAGAGYEEVEGVLRTVSEIPAGGGVRGFAGSFEAAFPGYRVLHGGGELYALRGDALTVTPSGGASVFLPRPISNILEGRDGVAVRPYESGKGFGGEVRHSYRDVDLNVWLKNALAFIDGVLTPDIVSAARLTGADCGALLEHKRRVAVKLAGLLTPAFAGETGGGRDEARAVFEQRLLASLGSLYGVKAVVTLPAEVSAPAFSGHSRLYGTLGHTDAPVSFTPPKLSLGDKAAVLAFAALGPDVVQSADGAVLPSAALSPSYSVTHVETEITPVAGGFERSSWLGAVTGDIARVPLGEINLPFPLYTCPEVPSMRSQDAHDASSPFRWRYSLTYALSKHYPQSVKHCKVRYNVVSRTAAANTDDIFAVLACFVEAADGILSDLTGLAARICAADPVTPDLTKDFGIALGCAAELAARLAGAELVSGPAGQYRLSENELNFTVKEGAASDGRFTLTVGGSDASSEIIPSIDGCEAEYVPGNTHTWRFIKNGDYLTAAEGQSIRDRTLILPEHDTLTCQNAAAEVYVEQNRELCPGRRMNDCFVFTTGTVAFDSPLQVLREVDEPIDMSRYLTGGSHTIGEYVAAFLTEACGGADDLRLTAVVSHASRQHPDMPETVQPIFSQTPVTFKRADIGALANEWEAAVKGWRRGFPIAAWREGERLLFSLTFMATLTDAKPPLLTLRNVFLKGEALK